MAVISFKCPNCDGELIFDPETQKYKCEYCGSKFTQAELDALQPAESEETDAGAADGSDEAEQETTEQQSADTKKKEGEDGGAEAVIYNCPSCGQMQRQQPRSVIIVTIRSCLENGWKESIFQIKSFLLKFPKRKRKNVS